MKLSDRQSRMQALFREQEFMSAEDLAKRLEVSDSTVRRDLIELEAKGIVRRVHGGAISLLARDEALDFRRQSVARHEEKTRIGAVAAECIRDGQTVMMGGGSTVLEVAARLQNRSIQVITNSIPIAQVFWESKKVEVILTGGYLYPRTGAQLGPICEDMLSRVNADVLIMGIGGISKNGLSDSNSLIVGVVRKMIERCRQVIIVADHTKFGLDRLVHLAPLDVIDILVSDTGLDPACLQWFTDTEIRLG